MKAVIVGLGPHGKRMFDAANRVEGLEVAAIVDRSSKVLEEFEGDAQRFTDLEAAFKATKAELACICTNGPSHAALAIASMDHGATLVLVEKPMGCSVEECNAIMVKAAECGARVAVDHPRRYSPGYCYAAKKIASGDWGELRSIFVQRPGIGLGCLATHSYDLVRFLSGSEVTRVAGYVDEPRKANPRGEEFVDPGGLTILELASGARGIVTQIEDGAGPISVEIDLTAARVRICEKTGRFEVVARDLAVKKGPGRPAAYETLVNPGDITARRSLKEDIPLLLADFVAGSVAADGVHGTASIEVLVATYLSHERGNVPVALPLRGEDLGRWLPVT